MQPFAISAPTHSMLKYYDVKASFFIFLQYTGHAKCHVSEQAELCDVENAVKKRKFCSLALENSEEAVTDENGNSAPESTG